MTCTHKTERSEWQGVMDDWTGEMVYEWVYWTEHHTKDISTGAFQCTRCGHVGYYTGLWKKFFEEGVPCSSSTQVRPDEIATVQRARKGLR